MQKFYVSILLLIIFSAVSFCQTTYESEGKFITTDTIDSLLSVAEHQIQHDKNLANEILTKTILLSDSLGYKKGKILAYCNLAFLNYIDNKIEFTKNFAERALSHSRKIKFSTGLAKAYNILGLTEWRKGSYSKSIEHYLNALNNANEAFDKEEISKSYNYLGLIFWKTGNYPKSISYLYKSLQLKEELNNANEIAITLNNLSNVYNEIGNYQEAILLARRAFKISSEIDVKYSMGRALGNLGVSYLKLGKTNESLNYLNEAIKIKRNAGELKGLAYSLLDIGEIYYNESRLDEAKVRFQEALKIMGKIDDSHGLSLSYLHLAKVNFKESDFSAAISNLKKSDQFAKKENLKDCLKNNLEIYSQIYEKLGNINKAYNYFKNYSALKDTVLNSRARSEINEIKINYETAQKEKENELLKTENELKNLELSYNQNLLFLSIIVGVLFLLAALLYYFRFLNKKKMNDILVEKNRQINSHRQELSDINSTKDKLFSIIAHDLRNPFMSLINSSGLLISDFHHLSDEDKLELLGSLNNSAKTNLNLLENLLTWARNQKGSIEFRPNHFNITNKINANIQLVEELAIQKQIKINSKMNQDFFVYADEYMVDTVLRNLIGNAVKFTNRGGQVSINSELSPEEIKIHIKDSGQGISKEDLPNIFKIGNKVSTPGTEGEPGSGLGLIISKEFIERNNGQIGVESTLERGSTFWFSLPIKSPYV